MTNNKRVEELRLKTATKRAAKKKEAVLPVVQVKKKKAKMKTKKVLTDQEKEIEKVMCALLDQEAYVLTVMSFRGNCQRQCADCRYHGCQNVIVFSAPSDLLKMVFG